MTEQQQKPSSIRISRLQLRNFKGIESLDLEFPPPRSSRDADITMLGGPNGSVKTTILEACALCLHMAHAGSDYVSLSGEDLWLSRVYEDAFWSLIGPHSTNAQIVARIEKDGREGDCCVGLEADKPISVASEIGFSRTPFLVEDFSSFKARLFGASHEPMLMAEAQYYHSYRKVREGPARIILSGDRAKRDRKEEAENFCNSVFKSRILRAILGNANVLVSNVDDDYATQLDKYHELLRNFANAGPGKLLPHGPGEYEILVRPADGKGTFGFDLLSSGQKEIVSTLFSIWHGAHSRPSVILIDEPELHLNAEWHKAFIREASAAAPDSQFIMATHSVDVFGSVPSKQRILFEPDES